MKLEPIKVLGWHFIQNLKSVQITIVRILLKPGFIVEHEYTAQILIKWLV